MTLYLLFIFTFSVKKFGRSKINLWLRREKYKAFEYGRIGEKRVIFRLIGSDEKDHLGFRCGSLIRLLAMPLSVNPLVLRDINCTIVQLVV